MKLRDFRHVLGTLLGMRPKPRQYPWKIVSFELPKDGHVEYAQWLHPKETRKILTQQIVDELRKFLRPGDVAIDIGAHTGDTSLPMALAVGPAGCVLALEPNPYVFPILKKNSVLNPSKTRIVPLMIAATPVPGEFIFEYSDPGFCNGGFHVGVSKWKHGHLFKLRVRGENLQRYVEENFSELIPRIRYVKIDVEGFDYQVLNSISDLITRTNPFIKVEFYKHLTRERREQMYDLLEQFGYELRLVESETNYFGQRLTKTNLMRRQHFDAFCIPQNSGLDG